MSDTFAGQMAKPKCQTPGVFFIYWWFGVMRGGLVKRSTKSRQVWENLKFRVPGFEF